MCAQEPLENLACLFPQVQCFHSYHLCRFRHLRPSRFCSPEACIAANLKKKFSVLTSSLHWPLLAALLQQLPKHLHLSFFLCSFLLAPGALILLPSPLKPLCVLVCSTEASTVWSDMTVGHPFSPLSSL